VIWFFVIAFVAINLAYGISDDAIRDVYAWEFEQAATVALSVCFFLSVSYRSLALKIAAACVALHSIWVFATDWAISYMSWWGYTIEPFAFLVVAICVHERAKNVSGRQGP
jgi:hypothetical protein